MMARAPIPTAIMLAPTFMAPLVLLVLVLVLADAVDEPETAAASTPEVVAFALADEAFELAVEEAPDADAVPLDETEARRALHWVLTRVCTATNILLALGRRERLRATKTYFAGQ